MAGLRVRRRSAPLQIRLLNGAINGSSAFYGVSADNLTETLRGLQDTESLQKFADGDPESFLAYWTQRQKTLSPNQPLYAVLKGYADKAQAKLDEAKEDASALARYASTNNHQEYLNYLLGKLSKTTDPKKVAALTTAIQTLRARVFAASGGGDTLGGGVTKSDFNDAKNEFFSLRDAAREIIANGGTISADDPRASVDIKRLDAAGQRFAGMLKAIIADQGVKSSVRNDAYQQLYAVGNSKTLEGTGPLKTVQFAKSASDQNQIKDAGFDTHGNDVFNSQIAAAAARGDTREVARLWADRAAKADVLLQGVQSSDQQRAVSAILSVTEENAQKAAAVLVTKAKTIPESAQNRLDGLFGDYLTASKGEGVGKARFLADLRASKDLNTFKLAVGLSDKALATFMDAGLFAAAKEDAQAGQAATWNPLTQQFEGADDRVKDAESAADVITRLLNLPGNIYSQKYAGLDTSKLTDGDKVDLALGRYEFQGGYGVGGPRDESANAARQKAAEGVSDNPGSPTGMPTAAVEPKDEAPVDLGPSDATGTASKQGPGLATVAPEGSANDPNSNDNFSAAVQGVDNYLTQYDSPTLPDFTPPEPKQSDLNEFFPFAGGVSDDAESADAARSDRRAGGTI